MTKFGEKDTSLITILSSHHGRLRREQRDINKRDLQKAIKHGSHSRAWGRRWLVEYDGITFITDESMRCEVTAFPSPLPTMELDVDVAREHMKAKDLLRVKPELATSHTVLIIDNSGSMLAKKNNVLLYRDSQNAAFSITALEFVAEQLFNNTAVNSDLVSLIKFSRTPSVEIEREPMGWTIYNKLLKHRNVQKYVDRQFSPSHDQLLGESNFIPALEQADKLLKVGYHEKCAISLFFFSDGRATDHVGSKKTESEVSTALCQKLSQMASYFGKDFTATVVGLGESTDDFTILRNMASAVTKAGAKGNFELCNKTAQSITSSITSLVTSTAESRISLLNGRSHSFTNRNDAKSEDEAKIKFDWKYFVIEHHMVYDSRTHGFRPSKFLPPAVMQSDPLEAHRRQFCPPSYLAVNRNYFGKGAERLAFRCHLSDREGVDGFVFGNMVAKETKDVERIDEKIEFHRIFLETQDLASFLAEKFNEHIRAIPSYDLHVTPVLNFLPCSILLLKDPNWPSGLRGVLVEKMLDRDRFPWTKWNDNNGMVDGKHHHVPIDVDFELRQLQESREDKGLGAIIEEEDESSDDSSLSDIEEEDIVENIEKLEITPSHHQDINPSDYLQAFTHFTYRYTYKKVMVCDLQGIFNTEMKPPRIELTDPAIHYASTKGRRMVYGRTDKGQSGMKAFFKTHKCTKICKYLQLSARNKKWNKRWRQDFSGNPRSKATTQDH